MNHFKRSEFACKCGCGDDTMNPELLTILSTIRTACNFPFIITSAKRCVTHNKAVGGHPNSAHMKGEAVDIACEHRRAGEILTCAMMAEFTGIGVSQKGNSRFIHLDISHDTFKLWSY